MIVRAAIRARHEHPNIDRLDDLFIITSLISLAMESTDANPTKNQEQSFTGQKSPYTV
jgi:hypothetical protein